MSCAFATPFAATSRWYWTSLAAESGDDHQYHIVSPPGSGKTIVGLELIRRFGQPAVVFAPTTTIQKQWQEKIGMFCDDPGWIERHTSLDPRHLAEINILTYQVLSTPGENLEFVERIAIERWIDDLLESAGSQRSQAPGSASRPWRRPTPRPTAVRSRSATGASSASSSATAPWAGGSSCTPMPVPCSIASSPWAPAPSSGRMPPPPRLLGLYPARADPLAAGRPRRGLDSHPA